MIFRIVLRSLATRPMRAAVLAFGFGLAVAVMAELLGVGEVILEQAHSPALRGGGDLVVAGAFGPVDSGRFVLTNVIGSASWRGRVAAASPSRHATLYVISRGRTVPVSVRGGIPSLEKAVGDPEVAATAAWTDAPGDEQWSSPDQTDILRAMDRFHPVPRVRPEARFEPDTTGDGGSSSSDGGPNQRPPVDSGSSRTNQTHDMAGFNRESWAEWLYFNGRSSDGQLRFYLTFLTGAPHDGKRPALVRLQLDRAGRTTNYSASAFVDDNLVLDTAPDLDIAGNQVRLAGAQYHLTLALARETGRPTHAPSGGGVRGEITLDAPAGRSLPPATIEGARGWTSGYVAPVLSGTVHGSLSVDGETLALEGLAGYHDHNWGFWDGVRWQWGQVAHDDLSIIFGRLFPPAAVADPDRVPGFLGVLGRNGPIGFSTSVEISEQGDANAPQTVTVHAVGEQLDIQLAFAVTELVRTPRMLLTRSSSGMAMDFLQLGGTYRVSGRAGPRDVNFTARGSAETFRQ
jgi:hypothetical protein